MTGYRGQGFANYTLHPTPYTLRVYMVKVRFAPSPTGYLHVGNARTAVLNHLFARNRKGSFVLRIEDTDIERSDATYESSILEDLEWLGIPWDEGPFRQSERLDVYRSYAGRLLEKGNAYQCFCTKDELDAMRKAQLSQGKPPRYNGKCRNLSERMREGLLKEGAPYVLRFKSFFTPVSFTDEIHGEIHFPRDHVDDFIILKQERTPSYNFAVSVDDMLMGITHVIRGADHISNTPKQIMLCHAFDAEPPVYAHHSLITGMDKKPLSKRHGATRVREFRDIGILRQALINYLAILGRSVNTEFLDETAMSNNFSLNSLSPSDCAFDMDKLLWMNKEYIRRMPVEDLVALLGLPASLRDKVNAVRENASTLNEIRALLTIFDSVEATPESISYLKKIEGLHTLLPDIQTILTREGTLDEAIRKIQEMTKLKKNELLMTIRILCTGRMSGPPLHEIFPLITKDSIIKRVAWIGQRILS